MLRQERNSISNIHRFITSEYGENYWFNGCARYVMEALGEYQQEPDFGYWFFSGLTGDILTQVFSYGDYMGECLSACRYRTEGGAYLNSIFQRCGYESTFVSMEQLNANKELHLAKLMKYIDQGIPVIAIKQQWPPWCVYVGYEEYGQKLLLLTDNLSTPRSISADEVITDIPDQAWLFIGEKKRNIDLAKIYREALASIPQLFGIKNEKFCCGAEAFYAWAAQIDSGYFDQLQEENFSRWEMYTSNICNMATNGCCVAAFLQRVKELNPDLRFIDDLLQEYETLARLWEKDNGKDLESIGAGFNITFDMLKDQNRRKPIVEILREAGNCMDRVKHYIEQYMIS